MMFITGSMNLIINYMIQYMPQWGSPYSFFGPKKILATVCYRMNLISARSWSGWTSLGLKEVWKELKITRRCEAKANES
jgi:hypothetical protein